MDIKGVIELDLEQLGYFLYMDQMQKEEKERQQAKLLKVNAEFLGHLVAEQTTQSQNEK